MATTTGNNDFMVNMKLEELEALSVAELNSRIADLDKKAGSGSTDGSAKASIFSATVATRAVLKFKNFTFEAGPDTPRIAVPTTPRNTVPEKPNVDAIHDIINYNPDKVKKLSISELEGHIERLKDAQKDKHVSADLKIMIPDKIVVAEMARENQRHRHLTSQPFQREEVSGEKTRQVYLRMGWIELEVGYVIVDDYAFICDIFTRTLITAVRLHDATSSAVTSPSCGTTRTGCSATPKQMTMPAGLSTAR